MNEKGFNSDHINLQLTHQKRDKVEGAYNHAKYLEPRKEPTQWWTDYLDEQRAIGRNLPVAH
jgi:hypothetical protein